MNRSTLPQLPFLGLGIVGSIAHSHVAMIYLMVAMMLTAMSYGRMASAFPVPAPRLRVLD